MKKGLPGVVIGEPSKQVFPSQDSQREATSTGEKGKEKVEYEPRKLLNLKGPIITWIKMNLEGYCKNLKDPCLTML